MMVELEKAQIYYENNIKYKYSHQKIREFCIEL